MPIPGFQLKQCVVATSSLCITVGICLVFAYCPHLPLTRGEREYLFQSHSQSQV